MSVDIAALDLRWRRRSLLFYPLGIALYTLTIVAMYPSFAHDKSLDALTQNSKLYAAFGVTGSLTSPVGWVNANLYNNFVPLLALMVVIGFGASALAGQNEEGTLGMVAALPVSRRSIVLQKFAVLALLAFAVCAAAFCCVLVGRGFQLPIDVLHLGETSLAVVVLGALFGALAMLLGVLTGSRGTALGVAAAVAAATYLISSLAAVVSAVHPIRFVSPFYWAVGNGQLASGVGWGSALALVLTTSVLLAATVHAVRRLDIR